MRDLSLAFTSRQHMGRIRNPQQEGLGVISKSPCGRGNSGTRLWSGLGGRNGAVEGFYQESLSARGNSDIWWILSNMVNVDISQCTEGFRDKPRYFLISQGGDLAECSGFIPKPSVGPFMRLKQLQREYVMSVFPP